LAHFLAFLGEMDRVRRRVQILRLRTKPLLGLVAAAFALARPAPASAFSPYLVIPDPSVAEATPAYRYANMTDAEAFDELDRRKLIYTKLGSVPGVRAPVRLTGRLHGVYIHSSLPPDERVKSMFEILDARLLLALDDFTALLERHDIDEVIHFTMYRPNVAASDSEIDDEPQARGPMGRPRASQNGSRRDPGPGAQPGAGAQAPGKPPAAAAPAKPAGKLSAPGPAPSLGPKGALESGKESGKGAGAPLADSKQKGPDPHVTKPEIVVTQAGTRSAGKSRTVAQAKGKGSAPLPLPAAPAGKPSRSAKQKGSAVAHRDRQATGLHRTTWAPPGTRHPAGLAIDVGLLHKKDGRWLSVAQHFHGRIGDKTCGEWAHVPADPDARELRALVCESSDQGLFTYVLTPNYNAAHVDHFHMEIKPDVHWFLYH
jgi:hypothetical protein